MIRCASCSSQAPDGSRYCPSCAEPLPSDSELSTVMRQDAAASPGPSRHESNASRTSSSGSLSGARFIPGTILAGRYRIVGLLGRGGMGEVYRAEDLKLNQQVALKFMPAGFDKNEARIAMLLNEVRTARQVSHPNVCRVYDVGDVDGQHFLTMEYVDGEDLASLLRRIGRLPRDKAIQMARQLCAGLAAAHAQGILHRDLKPANVMIDGRGRVRITDFGLAGLAGGFQSGDLGAGTPGYMPPEQMAGKEVTVRSDLYSLGLVLYELFTGKPAFQASTLAEFVRLQRDSTPTNPSTLVEGLDPAVERAILRCLEKEPKDRPASALALAAALPGGDPLAAALAAGETPSPEMVAAAGETGGVAPSVVRLLLLGLVVAAGVVFWLAGQAGLLRRIEPPKSAEVLVDRAQSLIRSFGYDQAPADFAYGFGWHRSYLESIRDTNRSPNRWDLLSKTHPTVVYLRYRQSPNRMIPSNSAGTVTPEDPPPLTPGMIDVMIAANGDLWSLDVVAPETDDAAAEAGPPDWDALFTAAGLRMADFHPAASRWVPLSFGDTRLAWEGKYQDAPDHLLHVEAASLHGRPVFFHVYWPWNRPLRAQPFEDSPQEKAAEIIVLSMGLAALLTGLVLVKRNLHVGRVDRKGAFRIAAFVFAASLISALCTASHTTAFAAEWELCARLCGVALFNAAFVWVGYVVVEPLVRRRWPERIISWTRLLSGHPGDPLVGRDILAGVALGLGIALIMIVPVVAPAWLGRSPVMLDLGAMELLAGPAYWVAFAAGGLAASVNQALVLMLVLFLLRRSLCWLWLSTLAFFALLLAVFTLVLWDSAGLYALPLGAAAAALGSVALIRFGLVSSAAAFYVFLLFLVFPIGGLGLSERDRPGLFVLLNLAVLIAFAARAALAGRPLFQIGEAES